MMKVMICQGIQNEQKRIVVFLPNEAALLDKIRQVYGRKWCPSYKCWHFPYSAEQWKFFKYLFRDIPYALHKEKIIQLPLLSTNSSTISTKKIEQKGFDKLNIKQKNALIAFEEVLLLERKSWRTIKTYHNILIALMLYYPKTLPSKISAKQIEQYLLYKIREHNIAVSTHNQIINGLKAFYERVLHQPEKVAIKRPSKPKKLPNVFSKEEIQMLLKACHNLKHKTILALIYSAGLRRGEVLNLHVQDINFARKCIFIKDAKGNKDRYVLLSDKAAILLKAYKKAYRPVYWLFEGQAGGRYSERSIQKIFDRAKLNAGVNSYVTLHGLRHSFATHLVENGVPLSTIKDLLGHNSIKTTEIYIHISDRHRKQLRSPLDDLDI